MPPQVAAASSLDIPATIESYTAQPPRSSRLTVPRCGRRIRARIRSATSGRSRPSMVSRFLVPAVEIRPTMKRGRTLPLRRHMRRFGNAGVHLPEKYTMSYPVAGRSGYHPPGYRTDHPLVPHGVRSSSPRPPSFLPRRQPAPSPSAGGQGARRRNRAPARRCRRGAGRPPHVVHAAAASPPSGAIGYSSADIPALVEGALLQRRLTAVSSSRTPRSSPRSRRGDVGQR